jgi:flagellar hook-length control protein FliK
VPVVVDAAHGLREHGGGNYSLSVRLDPPELGSVRIEINAHQGEIHLVMHVDTPDAHLALHTQREGIERLLSGEGFGLAGFDVQTRQRRDEQRSDRNHRTGQRDDTDLAADEPSVPGDAALRL